MTRRLRPVITALGLLVVLVLQPPGDALAQGAGCDGAHQTVASQPIAPASVAADLPEPFAYGQASFDHDALRRRVAAVVSRQAAELGADACFSQKPTSIVERIDFLSPFEFLVVSMFEHEPNRRDALLKQYASDPRAAIRDLGQAYPSPRAQVVLTTYAFYDVDAGRIRVNAARIPPDEIERVLVHEVWHAMPRLRVWTEPNGTPMRANGFWLQEQRGGQRFWIPVDERRGLPYVPYLLDEAMATLMETRHAGPSRIARPELDDALNFLDRLMAAAGPREVLVRYLDSRPMELIALIDRHRPALPEPGVFAGR